MERYFDTPTVAYWTVLDDLLSGVTAPACSRNGDMREIIGYTINIAEPLGIRDLYVDQTRRLNPTIGAVEALQLLGQTTMPEVQTDAVKVFKRWTDDGIFRGAYGQRVHGQFTNLVANLEKDIDTRQAVLSIHDAHRDLNDHSKDVPCTLTLQFLIRAGALILRVSMRSNDAWRGLPYDMTQFITLQAAVAAHFDIPVGEYQHTVGSMHLYASDTEQASDFVSSAESLSNMDLPAPDHDPLFTGDSNLADLSSWARRVLHDPRRRAAVDGMLMPESDHQMWLRRAMVPKGIA